MSLSNLQPAEGSVKNNKRLGRGQGSGGGGTSGRGHKGAQSRSGYSAKAGFEGGQMPLQRRVPKRGFKNVNRVEYKVLNLSNLQAIADKWQVSEITLDFLRTNRYISKTDVVKVLGRGELTGKLTVEANAISASAKGAIEEKGGVVTLI